MKRVHINWIVTPEAENADLKRMREMSAASGLGVEMYVAGLLKSEERPSQGDYDHFRMTVVRDEIVQGFIDRYDAWRKSLIATPMLPHHLAELDGMVKDLIAQLEETGR